MAGLLEIQNNKRHVALGQFSHLNSLDSQRTANNDSLKSQAKSQRNNAIGAGLGTIAVSAATGNPVGMAVGGLQILGSLF